MLNLRRTETWSTLLCVGMLLCVGPTACDKPDDKAEKKVEEPTEADKEVAARLAKKRADRDAAEKALADKAVQVQSLIVLPEKMPKDLKQACDEVTTAQDEFMKRNFDGEAIAKWDAAKETQLALVKTSCAKAQSIEIPACQTHAMNSAPPELKKELPELLKGCIDKFSAEGGGGPDSGVPPAQ
jgi:hypothetical protein